MAIDFLGEFEELVLTLAAALGDDAYGAAICKELEVRLNRRVTLSAVHVTLYRLEDKGLLSSKTGGATNERGGRRKRIYSITKSGISILRSMKETRLDLWRIVPLLKIVK